MKLIFLGTRGGIRTRSPSHFYHASLLLLAQKERIMIDCGTDWSDKISALNPTAVLVTHAHPDHAGGLSAGIACPVYATKETRELLEHYPLDWRIIEPQKLFTFGPLACTAFTLQHSLKAPAVGYRITHRNFTFFYAPDVVSLVHKKEALTAVSLYIGDGAVLTRTLLIRRRGAQKIGHAPFSQQLAWCKQARIPRAIITHCGSEIVKADPALVQKKIEALAQAFPVAITLAYDGMIVIPEEST